MVKFVSCSADNQGHAQSVSLSEDSRPQAISYHFQNPQTACFLPLSLLAVELQFCIQLVTRYHFRNPKTAYFLPLSLSACCGTPVFYTVGSQLNFVSLPKPEDSLVFSPLSQVAVDPSFVHSWFIELFFPFKLTSINLSYSLF